MATTDVMPREQALKRDKELAEAALQRADSQELFRLYTKAEDDIEQLMRAIHLLADHYSGSSKGPRLLPSPMAEDSVSAMERVALAAIDLAKAFATRKPEGA